MNKGEYSDREDRSGGQLHPGRGSHVSDESSTRKCLRHRIGMIGIIVDTIVLFMNLMYDSIVLSEINWTEHNWTEVVC